MRKTFIAAIAATAMISSAAFAAVTFDPASGLGFVGKGDVQVPFGWNNATLQKNAAGVTFTYKATDTYDVTCEWDTVTGGPRSQTIHHDVTVPKHTSVTSSIAADPRLKNQFTGFNLNGLGNTVTDGNVPVMGGACPGNNPGEVTDIQLTGSTGALSASFGDLSTDLQ